MNTLSKNAINLSRRAAIATSLAIPAALNFAPFAHAAKAPLKTDELFGKDATGKAIAGKDFAGDSGLGSADLVTSIANIIRLAIGFLGIVAVIIILLGGFKWMTSGGNEEKVKKAKALIIQGIVGLVIVLSSYAIANFVLTSIASVSAT